MYRYRPFDGEHRLYLERLLLHDEVFLASPTKVNDAFDCQVELCFDASEEERRHFWDLFLRRKRPELRAEARSHEVDRMVVEFDPTRLERDVRSAVDQVGLLCLTEKPDD